MSHDQGRKDSTRRSARQETVMEMTPMIDVTFLLLVFFLCTIRFKTLEGKIPAFLPKGGGVNRTPMEDHLESLDLGVQRVAAVDADPRRNPDWVWSADQVRLTLNGREVAFEELAPALQRVRQAQPDPRVTLRPGRGTRYIDAVKVLNECLRAQVTRVTFAGVPADA